MSLPKEEDFTKQNASLCRLKKLSIIQNKVTGPLPEWKNNCSIESLNLGINDLEGNVSVVLSTLKKLTNLYLFYNPLGKHVLSC